MALTIQMFLLSLLSLNIVMAIGQLPTTDTNLESNSFVAAYPKNGQFAALSTIRLHITTTENGSVSFNVSNPGMSTFTGSVSRGESVTVPIPYALTVTSINDLNKAIYIKAEGNKTIRVYSSNYVATSAGAFTLLPLHSYDTIDTYTYYVVSTGTQISNRYSTVVLVSGTQVTNVTITPTRPVTLPAAVTGLSGETTVQANEVFTFTMQPLQTVLLQNLQDITGTKIESNRPLGVIASHQCGMVPIDLQYCDHVVHQIPPTNTWGSNYMSLPFPSGTVYKMLAGANDTSIVVTCNDRDGAANNVTHLGPLHSGQWLQHAVNINSTWCSIVANGPLLIIQLAKGGKQRQVGDPMSLILTSLEQYTRVSSLAIPQSLYQTNLNQIIDIKAQIFVRATENISQIEMTLDSQPISTWTPIYSSHVLIGYATNVTGLSNNAHVLSSSTPLHMGVSIFGYSNNDAYSYPLNKGLNTLSTSQSSPLEVTFAQTNYTLIEGEQDSLLVMRQNRLNEKVNLTVRGCNGTPLPSNLVMPQTSISFENGEVSKNFELRVLDDSELSQEECFCIELVQPGQVYTFLYPYSKANLCIKDNEDVRVQVSSASVNEDFTQLDLTLSLTGYQGNSDMMIVIQPSIVTDSEEQHQQIPSLSPFNIYFTRYLSTATYTLHLSSPLPSDSFILINTMDTRLNITSEPVEITFPYSPQETSSSVITTSSAAQIPLPSSSSSPSLTSTPSAITSNTVVPSITSPPTDSLSLMNNYTIIVILPVLTAIVVVLLIISLVFCIATVCLIKHKNARRSMDFKMSELQLTSSTTSQLSIPKRFSEFSSNSYSSAESQDPNHVESSNTHVPVYSTTLNTNTPNHSCHNSSDKLSSSQ